MRKLLREPLVHFVLFGALLFFGHGLWAKWVTKSDYTIEVPISEMERQAVIFASENQRVPTEDDKLGLLMAHVEEQVLMREALRLGLDQDDTIIRRRLAQKMRFMLTQNTPPALPDEEELREWFETNKEQFKRPGAIAFSHIYFSPSQRNDIDQDALETMTIISDDNWETLGDPFIENNDLPLMDQFAISQRFGKQFAQDLFDLPDTSDWQGPVGSAFGLHLVRINERVESQPPSFDISRGEIERAWQEDALRQANIGRLKDLLAQYKTEMIE